ncbi:MAG: lantibiotic immunity ABC transporter MutG family permease subunit [Acetobacterium sp.]
MTFKNLLITDIMKLKSTSVLWLHFFVPIFWLILFLSYFLVSPWDAIIEQKTYLTAICVALPILIGMVTAMVAEEEYESGNYRNLLAVYPIKWLALLSKYLVLITLGALSIFIAVIGFYLGISRMIPALNIETYFAFTGILVGCSLFLYGFHLFLSLRFSKSVSIGIGIFEALIVALFRTGMGDGRWPFFPCSWSIRFIWTILSQSANGLMIQDPFMNFGIFLSVVVSILSIVLLMVWFSIWEGRKSEE